MRKTGLVIDGRFCDHDTGAGHPECAERISVLQSLLSGPEFAGMPRVQAREARRSELAAVHSDGHIEAVAASAGRASTYFDADTPASAASYSAALLAAGAAVELVDAVAAGSLDNGFAALRPPGHHAERGRPMGFCLFNNVAVAARHLRAQVGLERILVVDWDVHHGNGTQHCFYDDPSVMYVSLHQYPFYPGSGAAGELGEGDGWGFTVNVPMPAGTGEQDYLAAFSRLILPVAERFDPGFILVSAGFDAHAADPLAAINLQTATFAKMTDALSGLADRCCGGKIVALLEGGYDLEALSDSVSAVISHLREPAVFEAPDVDASAVLRKTAAALEERWGKL